MKKIILLSIIMASVPYAANAVGGDMAGASGIMLNDMQMLQQEWFRRNEVNDYNDLKEEKAKFWKKSRTAKEVAEEAEQQIQQKQTQIAAPSKRSEFVEENGQLKIKYY